MLVSAHKRTVSQASTSELRLTYSSPRRLPLLSFCRSLYSVATSQIVVSLSVVSESWESEVGTRFLLRGFDGPTGPAVLARVDWLANRELARVPRGGQSLVGKGWMVRSALEAARESAAGPVFCG